MKSFKITIIIAAFVFIGCNTTEKDSTTDKTVGSTVGIEIAENTTENDKQAIEKVVKEMYHWNEDGRSGYGLKDIVKDSLIVGYDMANKEAYLQKLRESGLFAEEFITNMDKIVKKQDELLRTGKVEWINGDISPFEVDNANNWCNCQDVPTDNDPFEQIKFTFTKLTPIEANIFWKWNVTKDMDPSWTEPKYAMRMVKEDNKWKIAWMQGWDYKINTTPE